MSVSALTWAFSLDIKPSSAKFVLVALADVANQDGLAFPSVANLADRTSQDRKTVIVALGRLEEIGVIIDTGRRVGRTGQVKVYRLQDKSTKNGINTEIGTVPETEANDTVFPGKSPVFGGKESQKRYTEPSVTIREPEESRTASQATPVPTADELADAPFLLPPEEKLNGHPATGRSGRGTRLPSDWQPDPDLRQFARSLGLDPDQVTPEFRDYWVGIPGARGCKLDWPATYRNRCRELAGRRRPSPRSPDGTGIPATGGGVTGAVARFIARRQLP